MIEMPQLRATAPNNNKAIVSGVSGAGSVFAAAQFYETFHWLWSTAGVPEAVAGELTVVSNMAIGFVVSFLLTWLTPGRSIVPPAASE